jgi:N-methylhydantoinase B
MSLLADLAEDVRPPDLDPITFDVLRNAYMTLTDEMAVTLRRTAYSTNVKTRGDFSCSVIDPKLRVIAQAGQPGHLVSIATAVPLSIREIGIENMRPGDAYLVNDPYRGSNHLNDITCFAPVFLDGALAGFVANMAHHVDVGGASPASLGVNTELIQEGVVIPPTQIVRGGEIIPEVMNLLLANVRPRREVLGDLRAQMSANAVAARRLGELAALHSQAVLAHFADELIAYTDRWVDRELRALPQGTFRAEVFRDDDGVTDDPIRLNLAVTIADGRAVLDVTGTSGQVRGPMNATRMQTRRSLTHILRCLSDRRVPNNSGFLDRVTVAGPDRTVLTAEPPGAVVGAFETMYRVVSGIMKALHPALPDRLPAAGKSLVVNLGFAGWNPRLREAYCYMETVGGGDGARPRKDGYDAVQAEMQNTENAPIEEVELNYPVMIKRYELIEDSGGAGRFRGGLGVRRDFWFPDQECSFSILSDGRKFPPWGLAGGGDGSCARYVLDPDGEARELPSKITLRVPPGGVVSVQTPGGGGFGPVEQRDPAAVRRDVANRKVSADAAARIYGVTT